MSGIVICLNICVGHVKVEASRDGLDREWRVMGQGIREDVTSSDLDCLLEKIMLQNDEPRFPCRSVTNDILPVLKDLLNSSSTSMNIKVWTGF